jgi:hypothetical protein
LNIFTKLNIFCSMSDQPSALGKGCGVEGTGPI